MSFFVFFASTWGPVGWVYQSEIFPLRVRAKGTGLATTTNWVFNAIVAMVTPYLINRVNFYVYLVFGTFGFLMSLYTSSAVPETMGKSLEEMDGLFGAESAPADEEMGHVRGNGYVSAAMKEYVQ